MTYDDLLSRLDGVRRYGSERAIARCPAHEDRDPSMSIARGDDGRVLLHCFGGCDVYEICSALGIELADLFPDKPSATKPVRLALAQALRLLRTESLVVLIAGEKIARGEPLLPDDRNRLAQAVRVVREVEEHVYGNP